MDIYSRSTDEICIIVSKLSFTYDLFSYDIITVDNILEGKSSNKLENIDLKTKRLHRISDSLNIFLQ